MIFDSNTTRQTHLKNWADFMESSLQSSPGNTGLESGLKDSQPNRRLRKVNSWQSQGP